MISWIMGLFNSLTGSLSALSTWVSNALNAVYSYIWKIFQQLGGSLNSVVQWIDSGLRSMGATIRSIDATIWGVIRGTIPAIERWAAGLFNDVMKFAQWAYKDAMHLVDTLFRWVGAQFGAFERWVINSIWAPLDKIAQRVLGWILKEGAYVYFLLTHPDKLVALLAGWLWREWFALLKRYGRTIARYLIGHIIGELAALAPVLEDVLTHLL